MTDTTRTRADRVQQVATFLNAHPEVDIDFSDGSNIAPRPTLHFHPRSVDDVTTVIAALDTSVEEWNQSDIDRGWVSLDSGALGYASVMLHLPRLVQPVRITDPEIAGVFA